jgi:hypothetical protein
MRESPVRKSAYHLSLKRNKAKSEVLSSKIPETEDFE